MLSEWLASEMGAKFELRVSAVILEIAHYTALGIICSMAA
jgi:hypothetical protein